MRLLQRKFELLFIANEAKYIQNPDLMSILLRTRGARLVEANPRDNTWSCGLNALDLQCYNPCDWKGHNLMGDMLSVLCETFATHPSYVSQAQAVLEWDDRFFWDHTMHGNMDTEPVSHEIGLQLDLPINGVDPTFNSRRTLVFPDGVSKSVIYMTSCAARVISPGPEQHAVYVRYGAAWGFYRYTKALLALRYIVGEHWSPEYARQFACMLHTSTHPDYVLTLPSRTHQVYTAAALQIEWEIETHRDMEIQTFEDQNTEMTQTQWANVLQYTPGIPSTTQTESTTAIYDSDTTATVQGELTDQESDEEQYYLDRSALARYVGQIDQEEISRFTRNINTTPLSGINNMVWAPGYDLVRPRHRLETELST